VNRDDGISEVQKTRNEKGKGRKDNSPKNGGRERTGILNFESPKKQWKKAYPGLVTSIPYQKGNGTGKETILLMGPVAQPGGGPASLGGGYQAGKRGKEYFTVKCRGKRTVCASEKKREHPTKIYLTGVTKGRRGHTEMRGLGETGLMDPVPLTTRGVLWGEKMVSKKKKKK